MFSEINQFFYESGILLRENTYKLRENTGKIRVKCVLEHWKTLFFFGISMCFFGKFMIN